MNDKGIKMKRYGMFMLAALPVIAAVLIQNIVANSLALAYYTLTGNEVSQRLMYLFFVLAILVCGVIFFLWYRIVLLSEIQGELYGEVQLRGRRNLHRMLTLKNLGLFALLGIGCQFFFSGALSLLTPLFRKVFSEYSEVLQNLTAGDDILVLLLMLVIAPVAEELIFRGVVLHTAGRYVTFQGANILQAVLFGVYHQNMVQGIYAAILGYLLGMVCNKYRTIVASILLHMMINGASLLLNLVPDTIVSYVITVLIGVICAATALIVIQPFKGLDLINSKIN